MADPTRKKKTSAKNASPYSGEKQVNRLSDRRMGKRNLYKKSKYYQKKKKLYTIIGVGCTAALLLLLIIFCTFSLKKTAEKSDTLSSRDGDQLISSGTSQDLEVLSSDKESEKGDSKRNTPVSIKVSVVGDCTLGTDEGFDYSTSLNAYYENYGKEYFFQNVKSIFDADDLTIANFEGTLTDSQEREDKTFAFKAPAEFAGILSSGGVEAVTVANNHSHDYGEQSFTDTKAALDHENIVHFGYDETAVMDVKGVKVGLVGIYELKDHLERTQQVKDLIASVKSEGAELVIVIFHWGNEKEEVPDENQMTLGRLAIDEGADLVCGHHPHVLQGIESYKGKQIVYSLGNFCFGGNSYPSDMDTMIFQQTFTVGKDGASPADEGTIIPCSISSEDYFNNYQPTPAEDSEKERIQNKVQERSSWIPLPASSNTAKAEEPS